MQGKELPGERTRPRSVEPAPGTRPDPFAPGAGTVLSCAPLHRTKSGKTAFGKTTQNGRNRKERVQETESEERLGIGRWMASRNMTPPALAAGQRTRSVLTKTNAARTSACAYPACRNNLGTGCSWCAQGLLLRLLLLPLETVSNVLSHAFCTCIISQKAVRRRLFLTLSLTPKVPLYSLVLKRRSKKLKCMISIC